jgi:hypothetical protein
LGGKFKERSQKFVLESRQNQMSRSHLFARDSHHGKLYATKDPCYGGMLVSPQYFMDEAVWTEYNVAEKTLGKWLPKYIYGV